MEILYGIENSVARNIIINRNITAFLKESVLTKERMEQIHKLNELAAQRGEKLADMALAWLLQKKEVTSVMIGASKTQQILDNIKAIHSAPFTDEELQKIDTYSL